MNTPRPPVLDMTIDGRFRPTARPASGLPWTARLLIGGTLVAVLAGAVSIAALALWVAMMLLPVMAAAAAVAYLAFRYRMWRGRRDLFRSHGQSAQDLTRPL